MVYSSDERDHIGLCLVKGDGRNVPLCCLVGFYEAMQLDTLGDFCCYRSLRVLDGKSQALDLRYSQELKEVVRSREPRGVGAGRVC